MRCIVQRVSRASVTIDGRETKSISRGLMILLGITHDDKPSDCDYLAEKCVGLRIFSDTDGKMNLSLQELADPAGECLVVSQFTLYGDARKGRRPSFIYAAPAEIAIPLYERFIENIRAAGIKAETGVFGADMQVELVNDGPVTILLDSAKQF